MEVSAEVAEPRIGRSAAIGAAIGFVLWLVVFGAIGMAGGLDSTSALGFGMFVGIWGGVGFGGMMGGILAAIRAEG